MDNYHEGINIGQEAKEVKNFFRFSQDDHEDVIQKSCFKKPPVSLRPKSIQSCAQKNGKTPRVRSASTGRDKRSELQARYWAFLFGNLQRSVNEIYQTVECYENLPSCQEAILVLENYIRDFKALAEWFKVSWDYEATPQPQRPQSLAWEVRKSNPAPRIRGKQLSSPAVSGKSSPSISGKISPCPTIEEVNKVSPKKNCSSTESLNKIKGNIKTLHQNGPVDVDIIIEPKEDNEFAIQTPFVLKLDQYTQTNLDDENLTLAEYLEKYCMKMNEEPTVPNKEEPTKDEPSTKPKEEEKKAPPIAATHSSKPAARPISNVRVVPPPKVQPRVVTRTAPTSSTLVRKSATVSQLAQNTSRPVNLPTKSATVSNLSSAAVKRPAPVVNSSLRNKVVPSNTASRLSARSKTMIEINNRKSIPPKASQSKFPFPRKLSKDDIDSSSSTLKAISTDKLPTNRLVDSVKRSESRKSEPKTMPSDSNNNDGWTMVKTKRRSSLHWATRFNQPSGYASLPSLTLLNEQQNASEVKSDDKSKTDVKAANVQKIVPKPTVDVKPKVPIIKKSNPKPTSAPVVKKPNVPEVKRPPTATVPTNGKPISNVSRQKSDLTGLKLKTLHKEFLRNEKLKDSQKLKSPPIPALLSSNIPIVSPASITPPDEEEIDELPMSKVDMNIQTNLISPSIQNLYMNINGEPHGLRIDNLLSSCDEFEEKEDLESDEDQRKLLEEQESLERQIRELENTEIDIDTETDETDCEAIIDLEDNESTIETLENHKENGYQDEDMTLEMRYESVLSDMSWIERIETLETLKAIVARHPGRAQQLHAKLSSPSRRRSLQETIKKFQARQTRAKEKRESLQKEKASKIQQLLARVEDVKTAKQQLIDKKRQRMEERLQKAAEKRNQYLKDKVKKAHDEEEKLKEIAFIKNLEQQNKMLDYFESCKEQEGRLQDLEQERQRRAEEKAAKEAAVERRRMVLEQERQKRLEQMSDIRREREKRVGQKQEQKQKLRQAIAREKARDREERLQAIQAQQLATTEELQRKIKQKQIESSKNREEIIEHIRQRASELAIPSRNSDENSATKSNGDENEHEDDSISTSASEKGKENHAKANKKRLKKLKQKMKDSAEIYLADMQPLPASMKRQSQVPKLLKSITKDDGPVGIERPLGQLLRLIAKAEVADFQALWLLDGLHIVSDIIQKGMESNSQISKRAIVISVQLYRNACSSCPQICRHAILGNSITVLFDALLASLKAPEEKSPLYPVELSTELILACTVALSSNSLKQDAFPKVLERLPDLISYTVSLGLLDVFMKRFVRIHEPVESQQGLVLSLLASLGLLTKLAELCPRGPADSTKFLHAVKATELFGTISLLYSTVIPIGQCIPPRTISLAAASFYLLSTLATLDTKTFQDVLSEENLSLKFLDVISVLLQYCGPKSEENSETKAVIIDLIATLGFFCANNTNNQDLLTSGQSLVIKCLTKLPKKFDMVLYPTLVTIIHNNPDAKSILSKDFDVESLLEYSKSDMAKKNKIVSLLEHVT